MTTIRLSTALLLLATVTVGLVSIPPWRDLHAATERADDRAAAMAVAKVEVKDLTTLSPTTLDPTLERLKTRLTGPFARQFDAFYSTFASVVREQKVTSRGSVQSVALSSLGERKAVALVAARAVVTSTENRRKLQRAYRFEVSLTKKDSAWLISGMRFVS
jgi:Mce-associated membrane protein